VDLDAARADLQAKMPRTITDYEFASWLMYPKVFLQYMADRTQFGDVSVLPTRAYFYGLEPGEEISVDLEKGKHLIIRYVTTSDVHDDGTRTVFFELNGQPRSVRVQDRSQVAKRPPRRKADAEHPNEIGAPMPGTIATVNVAAGHDVARGDVLVTIEAMKMETSVRAERDGRVKEVVARPGQQVDAKDLLVVLD
jgi:pyruvate carboxylase